MRELTAAKADAVAGLVRSLPDPLLRTLKQGICAGDADHATEPVRRAVEAELFDRRLRNAVLHEIALAIEPSRLFPLPPFTLRLLWRGLHAQDAAAIEACGRLLAAQETEAFAAAALELTAVAVAGLEQRAEAFEPLLASLDLQGDDPEAVIRVLKLTPIVRGCTPRARTWLKHGGVEDAAALRLAMRDASAICVNGGPLLIDLVAPHFTEPHAGLRLVSAVMERPKETYLAGSELAGFATALLDAAEAAVEALRGAGRLTSRADGAALAAAITTAVESLEELEHAVQLDRERPWGKRVAALRRLLASSVESRLKQVDGVVAAALPILPARPGLKQVRGAPCLQAPLDMAAVGRAEAAVCFVESLRRAAATGGFGGLRAKVIEALDARLDTYAEDLLDRLHTEGAASEDLLSRLHVAADLLGMVRDPSAAQIVRRRMAAA